MTVRVNFRWGNLNTEPTCVHGRIEGYCRACCPHKRRTTILRAPIGCVEQCDDCGAGITSE